jgi:hypothetical protein
MGSIQTPHFLNGGNLMTIMDAIGRIDELKPNSFSQSEKIKWLSFLDGVIKSEIIDTHEGGDDVNFIGYTEDVDSTTVLLVPAPYDDIYLKWLEAQMDYYNGEYGKYNNSLVAYNDAYAMYQKHYNRTHMPKGTKFKFF